jgi:hypothetical protein
VICITRQAGKFLSDHDRPPRKAANECMRISRQLRRFFENGGRAWLGRMLFRIVWQVCRPRSAHVPAIKILRPWCASSRCDCEAEFSILMRTESHRSGKVGAARSEADLCSALPCFGRRAQQIQFLLGHVSVQTTERYLGCKQRISSAVNDRIDSGRTPPVGQASAPPVPTLPAKANTPELTRGKLSPPWGTAFSFR